MSDARWLAGPADAHASAGLKDARRLAGAGLVAALRDSRARTWALVDDLSPAQWLPPMQRGVNPVAWELAHLAWFAEFWMLRGPHRRDVDGHAVAHAPARFVGPDAQFDSARFAHADRWTMPLPDRAGLLRMTSAQLDACADRVVAAGDDPHALCFARLALFHEDMHAEAFCWLRAALAYPAPAGLAMPHVEASRPVWVRGGEVVIGTDVGSGTCSKNHGDISAKISADTAHADFAFDNESPGHRVRLADFEIDGAPVTNAAFARFVEAGGYGLARCWPGAAGAWRAGSMHPHPQRWRPDDRVRHGTQGIQSTRGGHGGPGGWLQRWFDRWLPLDPSAPVMHVNAFEAEAYCLWAGRRLPHAAEWEHAAPQIHWGHSVWEWTADAFAPYPGFVPGPYREYSQPWFGSHRELRGGAFATHAQMHDRRYRNFFEPQRTDIFAGFRTASL